MSKLIGTIVRKDGFICLQTLPNAWFPLTGNSYLAERFRKSFNVPIESDLGRRLYDVRGVLQMESIDQMRERQAKEISA